MVWGEPIPATLGSNSMSFPTIIGHTSISKLVGNWTHPARTQVDFDIKDDVTILINFNTRSQQKLNFNDSLHVRLNCQGKGCQGINMDVTCSGEYFNIGQVKAFK